MRAKKRVSAEVLNTFVHVTPACVERAMIHGDRWP
jgi:hypothetical protein